MDVMTIAELIEYLKTLKQDYKVFTTDYEGRTGGLTKDSINENKDNKTYLIY